jgi:hypothetical protein
MSYVIAAPETMTSAASDLASIGSDLSAAHTAAAAPTVALVPAAADEVSAGVAHLFSQYATGFQALAGQAAAFHQQFVHNLTAGAGSYAATEAGSVASLTASLGSFITAIANSLNNLPAVLGGLLQFVEGIIQAILKSPFTFLQILLLPITIPLTLLEFILIAFGLL